MPRVKGSSVRFLLIFLLGGGALWASQAGAQTPPPPDALGISEPSIATSLPDHGDPWGARKKLYDHGISYSLIYTSDLLANVAGGTRTGTVYQGKVEGQFTADLEKLLGVKDLTFYANVFQIHNTGRIRRDYVGGLNTIAAIEAAATTRLSEMWFEQRLFDGKASFRFGQLAADSEFFYSDLSTMFLQSDWPSIAAYNLPSGGPAYPLSTPGVRLKVDPNEHVSLLVALFNGDPAGPCPGDPDTCNRYGVNFRVRDPAFIIGESQFRWNQGKNDTGLATTLKLGGWTHLGQFNDDRYSESGLLLADPASGGVARKDRRDYGIYGVIDQQLYRPRGGAPDSGISVFTRASVSPSDRNLFSFEIDSGIVFAGLIPGRPDDRFGASVIYSKFSSAIGAFDQDTINFTGVPGPVRDFEANLELTYMAQIKPGWTIQPDFQYIWHPSGVAGRDARVLGLRSIVKF